MRAVKFRGKRIDTGEWVYGYYFKTPLTDENSGVPAGCGWFFLSDEKVRYCISTESGVVFVVDIETVGQFTGLLDKNGKEIYEGDLIRQRKNLGMSQVWCIGKIVFKDGSFIIDWQPEKNGDIHYSETLKYHAPESGVIGNIFENENLLHT